MQILRRDQGEVRDLFGTWDVQAAQQPPRDESWPFRTWRHDEALDPSIHDIWCRPTPTQPWALQLMVADTREAMWLCRRSTAITRPLAAIGGANAEGIPYLVPEIQLLYKAKNPRPKDEADFLAALPALDWERRRWLAAALAIVHPGHAWLALVEQAPTG